MIPAGLRKTQGGQSPYEYAGGAAAFERLAEAHYRRCLTDPVLTQQFGTVAKPEHAARLAAWLGEVFGGPKTYSENFGGHAAMVGHHRGRAISEEQRARFVEAMMEAADEAALPTDSAFRERFRAYLEWGTRIAVHYSSPGAAPPPPEDVPSWGWRPAPPSRRRKSGGSERRER
jgi:hemoglobin